MQYSISHQPSRRGALPSVLVAAAAIALLLALAASAKAENSPSGAVAELTAESSASAQAAAPPVEVPAPVDTPDPVEAPADVEPATGGGEVVASAVSKTESITASVRHPIKTASATVETAAANVESLTEEAQSEVTREASEVIRHGTEGLVTPDHVRNLLPSVGALPERAGVGALSSPGEPNSSRATPELPSTPGVNPDLQPGGPQENQRATLLDLPFMQRITDFGGIEPLRLMIANADFSAAHALSATAVTPLAEDIANSPGAAPDRNGDRPNPMPSLPTPQIGASGAAPSSFVPIAALLALLALAAPAIRRRPWEGPVCSPPIPFVCALERPG